MVKKIKNEKANAMDATFYQKIIDQARDIILVIRPDGGDIMYANQAAINAYGYLAEELCNIRIHDLRSPETRRGVDVQMKMAQQDGILFRTVHQRRNGEQFQVEVSSRKVSFFGEEVLISIIRDITDTVAVEMVLKESEEKFRLLVENLYTGVFRVQNNRFTYVNTSMQRITGFDETELLNMNFWEIVHPDQREEVRERGIRRQAGFVEPSSYMMHLCRKDGGERWCEVVVVRRNWAGSISLIGLLHDVTDRVRAEEQLAIREKQYRLLAEHVWDIIWTIDRKGRVTYVSPSITRLQGYEPDEVLSRQITDIIAPEFRLIVEKQIHQLMTGQQIDGQERVFEFQLLHRDGSRLWVEASVNLIRDNHGNVSSLLGVSRDITERKKLQEDLVRLATTDGLTGAFNRSYFLELGKQELERSIRYGKTFSIFFIDIDHFKQINDTYGHDAGDQTLRAFAQMVRQTLRKVDVLGRLGGDEFAVLLPETGADSALQVAKRLRREIEGLTIQTGRDDRISITVSIGIASREKRNILFEDLLKKADEALYKAKALGRNRVQLERQ